MWIASYTAAYSVADH